MGTSCAGAAIDLVAIEVVPMGCNTSFELLTTDRVRGEFTEPDFVSPAHRKGPSPANKNRSGSSVVRRRQRFLARLRQQWLQRHDTASVERALAAFAAMATTFESEKIAIFADCVGKSAFADLVARYDQFMAEHGAGQFLHRFADLEVAPDFLHSARFADAFNHPLFRALIEFHFGAAAVRVDARCKDTEPLAVLAKENILHLDNSPFVEECKILVAWERGCAHGSHGQDLVLLPNISGERPCHRDDRSDFWSTENDSIFATDSAVAKLLALQPGAGSAPAIMRVRDQVRPLTTLFVSSAVPHHRYRTVAGSARSSITLAYHRVATNARSEIGEGFGVFEFEKIFDALTGVPNSPTPLDQKAFMLTDAEYMEWRHQIASAPTITQLKQIEAPLPLGALVTPTQLLTLVGGPAMKADLAANLDLRMYADGREETRKPARKYLREMATTRRIERLMKWRSWIRQPSVRDILTVERLRQIVGRVRGEMNQLSGPMASSDRFAASLRQLLSDLDEAVGRTYSFQNFLSTSLMVFWTCDEALERNLIVARRTMAGVPLLLRHYVASAIAQAQRCRDGIAEPEHALP